MKQEPNANKTVSPDEKDFQKGNAIEVKWEIDKERNAATGKERRGLFLSTEAREIIRYGPALQLSPSEDIFLPLGLVWFGF